MVEGAIDAAALFPGLAQFLQRRHQAQRVEIGWPQPPQHAPHLDIQRLRGFVGAFRRAQRLGVLVGAAVTDEGGLDPNGGAPLPQFVVKLAGQRQTFAFLHADQLPRQLAVVLEQIADARLGQTRGAAIRCGIRDAVGTRTRPEPIASTVTVNGTSSACQRSYLASLPKNFSLSSKEMDSR